MVSMRGMLTILFWFSVSCSDYQFSYGMQEIRSTLAYRINTYAHTIFPPNIATQLRVVDRHERPAVPVICDAIRTRSFLYDNKMAEAGQTEDAHLRSGCIMKVRYFGT